LPLRPAAGQPAQPAPKTEKRTFEPNPIFGQFCITPFTSHRYTLKSLLSSPREAPEQSQKANLGAAYGAAATTSTHQLGLSYD
jgi:hypothetical protein